MRSRSDEAPPIVRPAISIRPPNPISPGARLQSRSPRRAWISAQTAARALSMEFAAVDFASRPRSPPVRPWR
eukprot:10771078-Alexandrium_andersonii.AAC.1